MNDLIYVGRIINRQKCFNKIIDLGNLIDKYRIPTKIHVYGEGSCPTQFPNSIIYYGYSSLWIHSNLSNKIFLMTSNYEGCPLSLLEFVKYGGNRAIVINSDWAHSMLPSNCIFEDIESIFASISLNSNNFEIDRGLLSRYMNNDNYLNKIAKLKVFLNEFN